MGEEIILTCIVGEPCAYSFQDNARIGCKYKGYCDFQLPRDSRDNPPKEEVK
jgi:hypothetical protein